MFHHTSINRLCFRLSIGEGLNFGHIIILIKTKLTEAIQRNLLIEAFG